MCYITLLCNVVPSVSEFFRAEVEVAPFGLILIKLRSAWSEVVEVLTLGQEEVRMGS